MELTMPPLDERVAATLRAFTDSLPTGAARLVLTRVEGEQKASVFEIVPAKDAAAKI